MRPHHPNIIEFESRMDALPVTERCMFCTWEWQGTALEGRERALRHRLEAHPEVNPPRRRPGRHLKSFNQPRLKAEDWAEINVERDRRARLLGIAIE